MPLRSRHLKSVPYLQLGAVLLVLIGTGLYFLATNKTAHAAWYGAASPSVLCAPNTCNSDESLDSLQDVTINHNGSAWQAANSYAAGSNIYADADRRVLEIADQENHYMEEVVIGVYVSSAVYDGMPSNGLKLSFVNRACNLGGTPNWEVRIVGASTPLATYNNGSSRNSFCDNSDTISFDLSQQRSSFQDYANGAWKYVKISIKMTNYDGYNDNRSSQSKNVRFQLRLNDVCGGDTSCREYLALVASGLRNFSLSTRAPAQNKITSSASEADDPDYDYFNVAQKDADDNFTDSYHAIRQFMEFGLDCAVNVAQEKVVHIYDINDGDNGGSETHGWLGGKDIVAVVLQSYDTASRQWKNVAVTWDGAAGKWRDAYGNTITVTDGVSDGGDHASTGIDYDNHRLYALSNGDQPGVIYVPNNDDRKDMRLAFTMQTDIRYRIAITADHPYNFIAVGLPGDQIFGLVGCESYGLTPEVSGGETVAADSSAQFGNTITSESDSLTTATNVQWRSYGFVTQDGSTPSKQGEYDSIDTICSGLSACGQIGGGSGVSVQVAQTQSLPSTSYSTAGLHYGDKVCSLLAISPYESNAAHAWRVSATKCITITKTPRLQVWGNDVRVGSGFTLSGNRSSSIVTNRGSWGEYGVFAGNAITTFGSAASPSSTNLTFANTSPTGHYATAANLGTIPDVKTYLTKAGNATYAAKTGISLEDRGSASFTLPGGYQANKVYVTTGTVTIDQNITTTSTGSPLTQMVIIADTINIAPSVTQIDAWLIATSRINTCSTPGNPVEAPTVANCGTQLTVNGPLMTEQLLLRRTGGDDADQNSAAETINLRGDAYVWIRSLAEATGTVRTVYTRELAPRY